MLLIYESDDDDKDRGKKATRREAALRGIRRLRAESLQGGEPTGSERARARSRQRRARAIEDESTDDEGGDDDVTSSPVGPRDMEVET